MTYIPGGGGSSAVGTSSDVALNNVADKEVLTYDSAIAKWKNAVDPRDRTTHTGVQAISTITGLQVALDSKASLTVASSTKTASYTLAAGDTGTIIEIDSASASTITVPDNASVALPVGTVIGFRQYGTGQVTIVGATGVVLRSRGDAFKTAGQYSEGSLSKRGTDEWIVSGDMVV
ncbi:hypothetical protein CYG49_01510 [Candidatus Saccharibacteria bacterium]|nr:MAG: hypothetical protein CYG49_01510 [Candidatus Saccharibacteria bacterium]